VGRCGSVAESDYSQHETGMHLPHDDCIGARTQGEAMPAAYAGER
jgi:hypothetical protein